MMMQPQIDRLWRLIPARKGEKLHTVLFGIVTAPAFSDCNGILFATQYRVGVSSVDLKGSVDACTICGYDEITHVGVLAPFKLPGAALAGAGRRIYGGRR